MLYAIRNWLIRTLAGTSPVMLNLITQDGALVVPDSRGGYIDLCVLSNPKGYAMTMTDNVQNLTIGRYVAFVNSEDAIKQIQPGTLYD